MASVVDYFEGKVFKNGKDLIRNLAITIGKFGGYKTYSYYSSAEREKIDEIFNEKAKTLIGKNIIFSNFSSYTSIIPNGSIGKIVSIPPFNFKRYGASNINNDHSCYALSSYLYYKKIRVDFGDGKIRNIDLSNVSFTSKKEIGIKVKKIKEKVLPVIYDKVGIKIEDNQMVAYSYGYCYARSTNIVGQILIEKNTFYVRDTLSKRKKPIKYKIDGSISRGHIIVLNKNVLSNVMKYKLERLR